MAKKRIIITNKDRERLEDLFKSTLAAVFRNKPYLNDLRGELDRASVVAPEEVPGDVITMNSIVRLKDMQTKEVETFTLVYPDEANIKGGKLSVLAPLGTAILGYRVGDLVRWTVPSGKGCWRVEELLYQPERDGIAACPS
ncbi:nucleoside diphosphate kinase regulator [Stieleria mannarensis]|uniref:nucleoside diphosphate kinase regulator n=1 Tax=Stieleria mannarensis TaxID=2755585 RepID=UPI0016049BDE|nr:nucleoside diphosphate kinase regulator [Rhodopirellula sp. JC639]